MIKLSRNILILIILTGCSSQVVIKDPSIPDLLIEKSPYNVAIIYPENFNNFVHEEKGNWQKIMGNRFFRIK